MPTINAKGINLETLTNHLVGHRPEGHVPAHEHDCDRCVFIQNGLVDGRMDDWWLCPSTMLSPEGSLIARFGTMGDYASFPVPTFLTWNDPGTQCYGGTRPEGFVQQGRKLLAELGYRQVGRKTMIDLK